MILGSFAETDRQWTTCNSQFLSRFIEAVQEFVGVDCMFVGGVDEVSKV